jgi:hypothetical protein
VVAGLEAAYRAVAGLTAWADTVILGLTVTGEQVEQVIEPVRRAVIVLVNCIALRVGPGGLGRGSSLPDITRPEDEGDGLPLSQSSDSILELGLHPGAPPLLPRTVSGAAQEPAPPLPPKLPRPRFDRSFEDLLAQSYSLQARCCPALSIWSVSPSGPWGTGVARRTGGTGRPRRRATGRA